MILLRQLFATINKETQIILRDPHALAVLFVVPVVFVAILSLALRDVFSEHAGVTFDILVVDRDGQFVGKKLREAFADDRHFRVEDSATPAPDMAALEAMTAAGRHKFVLVIPPRATTRARQRAVATVGAGSETRNTTAPVTVRLLSDPALRADHRSMVMAIANGALRAIESQLIAERIAALAGTAPGQPAVSAPRLAAPELFAKVSDSAANGKDTPAPTSVQQNAPGWTLLAMFFLSIPLSVTFIKERAQGSLLRLQSMPVPIWVLFGGKIAPYLVINQIQLVLILAVGVWGLPLLGGDRLTLGDAPGAILLIGVSASLAAIGFALLVASFARTPEQATTLSATIILTLAALGGVMVPKIVMPPAMQQFAEFSPFSWGLDGFLDIFVRGGRLRDVLPEAGRLLAFAAVCYTLAILRLGKHLRHT